MLLICLQSCNPFAYLKNGSYELNAAQHGSQTNERKSTVVSRISWISSVYLWLSIPSSLSKIDTWFEDKQECNCTVISSREVYISYLIIRLVKFQGLIFIVTIKLRFNNIEKLGAYDRLNR